MKLYIQFNLKQLLTALLRYLIKVFITKLRTCSHEQANLVAVINVSNYLKINITLAFCKYFSSFHLAKHTKNIIHITLAFV